MFKAGDVVYCPTRSRLYKLKAKHPIDEPQCEWWMTTSGAVIRECALISELVYDSPVYQLLSKLD